MIYMLEWIHSLYMSPGHFDTAEDALAWVQEHDADRANRYRVIGIPKNDPIQGEFVILPKGTPKMYRGTQQ